MAKIKSIKYLDKDDPIYKEGFKVSSHNKSLQNYIKAREKAENKENLFLEKMTKSLVNELKASGIKVTKSQPKQNMVSISFQPRFSSFQVCVPKVSKPCGELKSRSRKTVSVKTKFESLF